MWSSHWPQFVCLDGLNGAYQITGISVPLKMAVKIVVWSLNEQRIELWDYFDYDIIWVLALRSQLKGRCKLLDEEWWRVNGWILMSVSVDIGLSFYISHLAGFSSRLLGFTWNWLLRVVCVCMLITTAMVMMAYGCCCVI